MTDDPVGVRVQRMSLASQTLVLASIVAGRAEDGTFTGKAVVDLFHDVSLPAPVKVGNVIGSLRGSGWATPARDRGSWSMTPLGRQRVAALIGDEAAALVAESLSGGSELGHLRHPLIPATLAPPQLVPIPFN